jgi:hypothetical protein
MRPFILKIGCTELHEDIKYRQPIILAQVVSQLLIHFAAAAARLNRLGGDVAISITL